MRSPGRKRKFSGPDALSIVRPRSSSRMSLRFISLGEEGAAEPEGSAACRGSNEESPEADGAGTANVLPSN